MTTTTDRRRRIVADGDHWVLYGEDGGYRAAAPIEDDEPPFTLTEGLTFTEQCDGTWVQTFDPIPPPAFWALLTVALVAFAASGRWPWLLVVTAVAIGAAVAVEVRRTGGAS